MPALILLAFLETITLLAIFMALYYLQKEKNRIDKRNLRLKRIEEEISSYSHKKAEKVLDRAFTKAAMILSDSENFSIDHKKELLTAIEKSKSESLNAFEEELDEYEKATLTQTAKTLSKIEEDTVGQLAKQESKLINLAESTEEFVSQKAKEEFALLQKQLAEYKQKRMEEIDSKIEQKINSLAKEIFGKTLSSSDQIEIIKKNIITAKEEGLFN